MPAPRTTRCTWASRRGGLGGPAGEDDGPLSVGRFDAAAQALGRVLREAKPEVAYVIVIISGPGGAGKGTIVARLVEIDPSIWLSRSWTTRERRPGESPDAYVFASRDEFMARARAGGFVEWTEFAANGALYGTPTIDAPPERDVLLEIELDGAAQVKRRHPEAVMILVVPPSRQVQLQRLRTRGDDEGSAARRVELGAEEESEGRKLADYVVVNDDVGRAAGEVASILERLRHKQ